MTIQSLMNKWNLFIDTFLNKGGYKEVVTGLINTLIIALVALVIGIIIGTIIAAIEVQPKKGKIMMVLNKSCTVYVAFVRGTPIVVQLLLGYFVILRLLGWNFSSVVVAIMIMGLNSGAYVSEIMRSGILSVDIGQMEAGFSLGLGYNRCMKYIILPQAIKNILPALGNEFITLVKETSVAGYIGIVELTKASDIIASNTYNYFFPLIITALIYLFITSVLAKILGMFERKFNHA